MSPTPCRVSDDNRDVGLSGLGYTDGMTDLYQKFVEEFECHTWLGSCSS